MSVCIKPDGGAGAREVRTSSVVLLPHAPASVAAARWHLAAELREAGIVDPAICDAALVVSELLSNAIRHARPLPGSMVQVGWDLTGGWLELSVTDGGASTRPHTAHPSVSSLGGRGLAIVEHLSSSWGARISERGTTVWALLPVRGDGQPSKARFNGHSDAQATASPAG